MNTMSICIASYRPKSVPVSSYSCTQINLQKVYNEPYQLDQQNFIAIKFQNPTSVWHAISYIGMLILYYIIRLHICSRNTSL